jgi:ribosomal protein S18 acetylase RimI-like enzyme
MRSVRKAIPTDVIAIRLSDTEFAGNGRKEFAERAINRGSGHILE